MKQIILSLVVIFLLASCQEQKSKKRKQTYEDQIKTELSKNIENETVFLGLKFGMGGEEVHNYFRDLVSQEKLLLLPHEYLSDNGKIYMYKFDFGDNNTQLTNVLGTFKTYYINDKMYKLRISVESEQDESLSLLKANIKDAYIKEYGQSYITHESIYNNSEIYTWIQGNMMIEISEGLSNNILIVYSDLVALRENKDKPVEKLMREI